VPHHEGMREDWR